MQASELFNQPNTILLDGGMGTMLQAAGMKLGTRPEDLNLENPELIRSIHAKYAAAGSRVVNANTFGASPHKLADSKYTLEEVITEGIANCKQAVAPYGALVTLDVGPLGELLEPSGTLAFEDAVAEYGRIVRAGVAAGADILYFETFTDLYEMKAALLAAKENSTLPIMASMSFEANGRTFTGCTVESFAATARGLGANAVGINCSLGPKEIFPMAKRLAEAVPGDFPVFVKPNAGLPRADGSGYDITPQLYAMQMKPYRELGLFAAGGCCGTTPEFIQLLNGVFADCRPGRPDHPMKSVVCSPMDCVDVDGITVVGERINPTGKKRLQQALRDGDLDYVVSQGISQQEQGADILDVNVGLPEIDEVKIIQQATEQLQGSTLLPLQIDSTDPAAVEAAVRRYAGKPIINSVNGKQQIMDEIFPLVAHYGTNVVGLTLDEGGIPDTAEARFAIAERIVAEAARYGIGPDRILIDCLVMTASTNQRQAEQILRAMSLCKERLGVKCALGVSNISFGLPARPLLGSVFLAAAFGAGLDAPIMNPGSKRFMDTVYSYRVLSVEDEGSTGYIERYAGWTDPYKIAANPAAAQAASSDAAPAAGTAGTDGNDDPIRRMVVSGRKGEIAAETERLLTDHDAMDLINNHFIPALDEVGVLFDQGKFFLPQLMASAEAARVGFDTIKRLMPAGEIADKGKICVATVKGDIHDIGKNIVKMLLDNYGYTVFDLGRDVDPQEVLKTVQERDIKLVGLSALMTTTVVAMEETIKLLHTEVPGVKIIVGGAVLTPEYAKQIGADYYAKDAAESARIAEEVFGQ